MFCLPFFRSTWDIFQTIPRERKSNSETSLKILKFIKVLMYGFLFIMVLGTAVMSKVSFIVLATNTGVTRLHTDVDEVGTRHGVSCWSCILASMIVKNSVFLFWMYRTRIIIPSNLITSSCNLIAAWQFGYKLRNLNGTRVEAFKKLKFNHI